MTEGTSAPVSSVQNVSNANASPKKTAKKATKGKSTQHASHPKYSDMIKAALKALNDRGGSSRAAILKFVLANYSLDPVQANQHLKLALKNGIKSKHFKQTKGNGASGSFKLATNGDAKPAKKKSTKTKKATSSTGASGTKKTCSFKIRWN
jgi:histone H1/5